MIDICEIFTHWHAGRSKNEIAGSLGLSRNTVRKYLAAAEAAGMAPGGPAVSQQEWAELARAWFPELADTRLRQVTWPAIGEHRDYIVEQLAAGVTMATIHQRLRMSGGWRCRWRRCAAMWRRTCRRRPAGRRLRCCGWCRPSRAPRRRSTTGSWAGGLIVLLALLFRLLLRPRLLDAARTQADRRLAGSMEGYAAMDMSVQGYGTFWQWLRSPKAFTSVSHIFVMEWAAVLRDIASGLLIAGAVAAWVPDSFWSGSS